MITIRREQLAAMRAARDEEWVQERLASLGAHPTLARRDEDGREAFLRRAQELARRHGLTQHADQSRLLDLLLEWDEPLEETLTQAARILAWDDVDGRQKLLHLEAAARRARARVTGDADP